MKLKHLLYIVLLGFCALVVSGCGPLKGLRPQLNIQAQKAEQDANIAKLEGDIKDLVGAVQAQGAAIAGVNNKLEQTSAGRDMVTTTVNENDPELIEKMFEYWWAILLLIIGLEEKQKRTLTKQKKFYKDRYIATAIKNEEELNKMRESQK